MYRKPSDKERKKIEMARKMTKEGIQGQKDMMSKFLPTMAKSARDDERMGRRMMEEVSPRARRYEADEGAPPMGPYAKGGKVKSYAGGGMVRGAGAAKRGVKPCKTY